MGPEKREKGEIFFRAEFEGDPSSPLPILRFSRGGEGEGATLSSPCRERQKGKSEKKKTSGGKKRLSTVS